MAGAGASTSTPSSEARVRRAILQQRKLSARLSTVFDLEAVRVVAGVDSAVVEGDDAVAAAVAVELPSHVVLDDVHVRGRLRFPYMPGLLAFREVPLLIRALRRLHVQPDVVLVDGHGLAHPRHFGSASQLGVLTGLPTIGVAKRRLVGGYDAPEPGFGA